MIPYMKRRTTRARSLASTSLRAIAYLLGVFEWLWVLVIALPPIIGSEAFQTLIVPPAVSEPVRSAPSEPSVFTWIFVGIVTTIVFVMTIIILIRLPKTVLKAGEKTVHTTSKSVLPLITHHHPVSAKRRRTLTLRINLLVQLLLVTIPVLISPFLPPFDRLSSDIIVVSTLCLAITGGVLFVLSWIIDPTKNTTSRIRPRVSRG